MPFIIIVVICYLCLLFALIFSEKGKDRFGYRHIILKSGTSACFILLAFAASLWRGNGMTMFFMLLPSLLFCMAGDILLAFSNVKKKFFSNYFLCGAISFAVGHALFILVFRLISAAENFWAWQMLIPPVLMSAFIFIVGKKNKRFRFGKMTLPGTIYAFCVGLMTVSAIRMCSLSVYNVRVWLMAAGAVLFFISDFILMFMYFYYKPRQTLRAFNLSTYYIGMMLIALAC